MPEQRKRLHCVAEITLSTTFLLASEVPAIAAFARAGLPSGYCSGAIRTEHAKEPLGRSVSQLIDNHGDDDDRTDDDMSVRVRY